MRGDHMRRIPVLLTAAAVLVAGCSSGATDAAPETPAPTVTTTAIATRTVPVVTTTIEVTTTTVDPARLPEPAAMEQLVRDYCSAWPDVSGYLAEDVALVDVSAEGWSAPGVVGEMFCVVSEVDEGIVRGRSDTNVALSATGFSSIDCGGPAILSGDLIAVPVSASRQDGTGEEGIWVFRIVKNQIQWLLTYGTDVDQVSPAATAPNPTTATEARDFCALYEGTGYARNSADVIAAMTEDPAIQHIPASLHCMGVPGIKIDVSAYFPDDVVGCGDIATNGQWSAQVSTIENSSIDLGLVGILVRQHVDGQIHRQYNQYTQTSGTGNWGFLLDDE